MVRERLIRNDPPLPDEAVLVRSLLGAYPDGRAFDRDELIADAARNFELFGYYGLSLWVVTANGRLSEFWRSGVVGRPASQCSRPALSSLGAWASC